MMFVKLICVDKFEMLNFAKRRRIITELKCVVVGLHKNNWNAYHPYHFPTQSIKRIKNNSELCAAVRVH